MIAGILPFGVEGKEFGRVLVVLAEVDQMRLAGQADLFQHDRDLHPVRRGKRVELEPVGMPAAHIQASYFRSKGTASFASWVWGSWRKRSAPRPE
jgi:hypothetical protein